jgi:hypothetical protein
MDLEIHTNLAPISCFHIDGMSVYNKIGLYTREINEWKILGKAITGFVYLYVIY